MWKQKQTTDLEVKCLFFFPENWNSMKQIKIIKLKNSKVTKKFSDARAEIARCYWNPSRIFAVQKCNVRNRLTCRKITQKQAPLDSCDITLHKTYFIAGLKYGQWKETEKKDSRGNIKEAKWSIFWKVINNIFAWKTYQIKFRKDRILRSHSQEDR